MSWREWFDVGYKCAPAPLEQLHSFFPRVDLSYKPIRLPLSDGETVQNVHDRLVSVMHEMIAQCDAASNVKAILTVGHSATVIAGVRAAIGNRYAPVNCGTCALSIAKRIDGEW